MAKAYKCDRCGEFYEIPMSSPEIWVTRDNHPYGDERIYDLCLNCQEELKKWLRTR